MVGKVSTGSSFSGLAEYLTKDEGRVAWTEPRWMIGTDPQEVAREMEAATLVADSRLEKPVYHVSISFSEADRPTREQMQQAADRVLGELGLSEHQALLVAHEDKGHPHLHVMANRVHPETGKAATVSFDYRRVESVLRELEKEWGMTRVPGHHARDAGDPAPDRTRGLSTGEVRRARRTGELPFPEQVREKMGDDLARALDGSKNWGELRGALARHGYEIEPTRRGMAITDGERYTKASAVDERLSRSRLEERFGEKLEASKGAPPSPPTERSGPDVPRSTQPEAPKPEAPTVAAAPEPSRGAYDQIFGPPALSPARQERNGVERAQSPAGEGERSGARSSEVARAAVAAVRIMDGNGDEREVPFKATEVALRAGIAIAGSGERQEQGGHKEQKPEPGERVPPLTDAVPLGDPARRLVEDVRVYERVTDVESRLGAAVQARSELDGQLRMAGRQAQEAGRLSDTFDRALAKAYRDPVAARSAFEELAARGTPETSAGIMRREPERFGPVVTEERTKWLGLAREVDSSKGYEAARGAANVGEQYLHTRSAAGQPYERLRGALEARGAEVRSLRHELAGLTQAHGRPADILQRIGVNARAIAPAQAGSLARALTPNQVNVVAKALDLAKRGIER
jgi:hypothetical protein